MEVTVHEAKTQLSRLLKLAEDGETVTIVRRGVPFARLTPVPPPSARRLGWEQGVGDDSALRPLTDDEAESFLSGKCPHSSTRARCCGLPANRNAFRLASAHSSSILTRSSSSVSFPPGRLRSN